MFDFQKLTKSKKMAENQEKLCQDCGKPISGRRDKKFCDDQCRNNFYNRTISETSEEFKAINLILKKNRRILQDLIPADGKGKVSAKTLNEKGFNQTYITHTYTTQAGAVYRYCYEYGYLPLEGDYFLIVKREKR